MVMLLALAWLTVSLPFVYACQQNQKEIKKMLHCEKGTVEEESNPFANSTEEKTQNGSNTPSEYLHEILIHHPYSGVITNCFKCHSSDLYFSYYPELVSPPPKA
ncbi:MAG: hypothetical protein M3342_11940 [Bacteroidota bacterium]|nr:hypothetical protein [Bacteroidota bacterium]